MAKKKSVKKKVAKKNTVKKPRAAKKTASNKAIEIKMQPVLVNNFIALQRVMVNLSSKFEKLNTQLSSLLNTFEMAAKTLAKKDFKFGQGEDSEKVVGELKELKEQNKVLAKGLTMIHEDEQEQKQIMAAPVVNAAPPVIPKELAPPKQVPITKKPKMPEFPPLPKTGAPTKKPKEEEYQKSEDKSVKPSK